MFLKKESKAMFLDNKLNSYRPKIQRFGDYWSLTVKLDSDIFMMMKIHGVTMKITVDIGPVSYDLSTSQFKSFGKKYNLPIEEAVTALIERWRFLNLIAEF